MDGSNKHVDALANQIKKLYEIDPERASVETDKFISRLSKIVYSKKPSVVEKKKANWILVVIGAIILFGGLAIIIERGLMDAIGIYLFGFVFFIAGTSFGILDTGALPVLFTHGLIGACVMMWGLLYNIINLRILSDLSVDMKYYMIAILVVFISAFVFGVICNVSIKYKSNPYSKIIPFTLFAIAFGMAGYLNYLF